jgi:hypothetical protein
VIRSSVGSRITVGIESPLTRHFHVNSTCTNVKQFLYGDQRVLAESIGEPLVSRYSPFRAPANLDGRSTLSFVLEQRVAGAYENDWRAETSRTCEVLRC